MRETSPWASSVYTTFCDILAARQRSKAELAQLDRASVYETEGRRFDSCIPRHSRITDLERCGKIHPHIKTVAMANNTAKTALLS